MASLVLMLFILTGGFYVQVIKSPSPPKSHLPQNPSVLSHRKLIFPRISLSLSSKLIRKIHPLSVSPSSKLIRKIHPLSVSPASKPISRRILSLSPNPISPRILSLSLSYQTHLPKKYLSFVKNTFPDKIPTLCLIKALLFLSAEHPLVHEMAQVCIFHALWVSSHAKGAVFW